MEDKIYEKVKNDGMRSYGLFLRSLGIIENENEINGQTPKKNLDFLIILTKLDLIEANSVNGEKIDEFHDYLFKLGISTGIIGGKKMIIEGIKNEEIDFDEIMDVNPDDIVNFEYLPAFISDLMEVN